MEIFMKGVSWHATHTEVALLLAETLHHPDFGGPGQFNFHVHLLRDKTRRQPHSGAGFLTVPTPEIGASFLGKYGGPGIVLKGRRIQFSPSKNPAGRPDTVQTITRMPYVDPRILEERNRLSQELSAARVAIDALQFGWDCRDQVMSIESEASLSECFVRIDEERRQFRIEFVHEEYKYCIAIRFANVGYLTAHQYLQRDSVIVFTLLEPPTYEMDLRPRRPDSDLDLEELLSMLGLGPDKGPVRKQLSFLPLPGNHEQIGQFTCLALRLVCRSRGDLEKFKELGRGCGFSPINSDPYRVERRSLFSEGALAEYNSWIRKLPWAVAFQVHAIVLKRSVDVPEMLDLLPDIKHLCETKGHRYAASLLRDLSPKVHALYQSDDDGVNAVRECFEATLKDYDCQVPRRTVKPTDGSTYDAYHATITPTTIVLDGPYPERSNRVIRAYEEKHQESFLRVTFAEEGRLQFRFDKEVDGREYVKSRIGPMLFDGLTIAGRKFEFLAYSQSALKEHSVWFVKSFRTTEKWIKASDIISSLGNFEDLHYDPSLIRCPARYAARLSQAFTATDASVSINIEEIFTEDDIEVTNREGQSYNFTDGVGTMSREVAQDIWRKLKRTRKRLRSVKGHPSAYQVRFMGSKGMLSVNYKLRGRAVVLRPSMIKFEAPEARDIEIARAFDRPTPYFLNRPLIMILEGLGVKYAVFKELQDNAVRETEEAVQTLGKAGKLLECYGLGSSFRISSVMNSLNKLGISSFLGDKFYDKSMEFAKNHVLRLLKNHARIPVPGAWTLVGVADVHKYLKPDQVFACVRPLGGSTIYLEGPVVISRSPTIHPGDVQVVTAIGAPPPGSCFEKERLANTVVFSVLGDRPLPSCLGGGDLDGDIYNIVPLSDSKLEGFRPTKTFPAASYAPATKKLLDRKSTMRDVAQFVMDYIVSDVLGIIAINWLITADQSDEGIFDADCIALANLHSDAVDYPKSGNPVDPKRIPRLKTKVKPDWNAPETLNLHSRDVDGKYYESKRAIGKLFRAIDLPAEGRPMEGATRITAHQRGRHSKRPSQRNPEFEWSVFGDDFVYTAVAAHVEQFIATEEPFPDRLWEEGEILFARYATELQGICITKTLSSARNASLTEEEAMIGTIVQKTSQPRRRQDMISRLRESTDILVRGIREVLEGGENDTEEDYLRRSWYAWSVVVDSKGREFGAQSFGWVALGAIFDAIRKIEEREIGRRIAL